MSEVCKWLKNLPAGGLHLEKCSKEFEKPWISYSVVAKVPSPRGHRCILPVTGETAVGRKTHLGKRNKCDCRPGRQENTALRPLELSQRFISFSGKNCYVASSYDSQMSPPNLSPLLDISPPTITTTRCNTTESSI